MRLILPAIRRADPEARLMTRRGPAVRETVFLRARRGRVDARDDQEVLARRELRPGLETHGVGPRPLPSHCLEDSSPCLTCLALSTCTLHLADSQRSRNAQARWNLEETRILEEAEAFANAKLRWAKLNRSERWTKIALWTIFKAPYRTRWNLADVVLEACERCGNEAGIRFIQHAPGEEDEWLGEACLKELGPEH
ncbi:hypothetical protein [Polyangium jinanense]|uniref:Uncharacterized protein n=1 Tax=Polyangium jinanense TaxID=2829994 RepID=A0A9X3XFB2_9BACT|nr:hypothetical protein [Polyangium jinanense]MDC3988425.1 hypothetical protein [Polyangium jinanense]